jgi:hypothetical protein
LRVTVKLRAVPPTRVSISGAVVLAAVPLGLDKVMVRIELPPATMVGGLKALTTLVGMTGAVTVKVAIGCNEDEIFPK